MDLKDFFAQHPKIALAFSGGVDSSYLLYSGISYAKEITAYYVKSDFQPEFEYRDAIKLADELGANLKVIHLDIVSNDIVMANPSDRCYYCKKEIFANIIKAAKTDGYSEIMDGTNASDDSSDRPGMKALEELKVYSPLRICGLTKDRIRELSKDASLFTWDKPSYACLATRIPTGEIINKAKLYKTERAENFLFKLGFSDFRLRFLPGEIAKIQINSVDEKRLFDNRIIILDELKKYYKDVFLDLKFRNE